MNGSAGLVGPDSTGFQLEESGLSVGGKGAMVSKCTEAEELRFSVAVVC